MDIKTVKIEKPDELNLILGHSHFIKTVEDIYETMVNTVPGAKFGLAFCESSGPCLVRYSGTDDDLVELAKKNRGIQFYVNLRTMIYRDIRSPVLILYPNGSVSEIFTLELV